MAVRAAVLCLLAALSLLLAACEYPGVPHPQAASQATESQPTETPTKEAGNPSTEQEEEPSSNDVSSGEVVPEEPQGPAALEGTVQMALKDFKLVPDEITVKAGEVTFALVNEGRFTHDFRIDGEGVDTNAGKVGARRSRDWQVTLEPGEYRISCRISNHDKRGMEGTMTVVP